MTIPAKSVPPPRERIIDAARDLFRKHGIRGIGVDAIADAAGSNKMTLYRHFGSKDDLLIACIEKASLEAESLWEELEKAHPGDAAAQLQDWVRRAGEFVTVDHGNCELLDAAAQLVESNHPAHYLIKESRRTHRLRLTQLCRNAGIAEAELLVDALTLLIEGARVNWRCAGADGPSSRFVEVAEMVIKAFMDRPVSCVAHRLEMQ
ncbi:TetR/AcrR family transcriptional regulator [Mesorhizobium sp. BAC0120]|uniref:TetR/AcrR family transcriptional regulator n=1 Tax=Mesorhizobium sp. BAC0120 TaxID=3090670 RepID=UPI00298D33AB|nr:TetR/AcrR family transcriptional regulator [Mesorhizobium sp. BAC0120]MDW6021494.1 TetR/AcrR family transcriptional regulator [Mesorhizobium sp. BAC0120]